MKKRKAFTLVEVIIVLAIIAIIAAIAIPKYTVFVGLGARTTLNPFDAINVSILSISFLCLLVT